MEEGVPGMLIRIAVMRPPEMPPTKSPTSRLRLITGSTPKVSGRHSAMAMVAVSPGIEPKMMPTTTPPKIAMSGRS